MKELVEVRVWMDIHEHDNPKPAATTERNKNGEDCDTDESDLSEQAEPAAPLPKCYSSLPVIEKKIVDRLTVAYFVNRLMTAGEKEKGVSAKLKPTSTTTHVGNSQKRAMYPGDYEKIIGI